MVFSYLLICMYILASFFLLFLLLVLSVPSPFGLGLTALQPLLQWFSSSTAESNHKAIMCILLHPTFVIFVALSPPIGPSIEGSLQIAVTIFLFFSYPYHTYICGKHLVPTRLSAGNKPLSRPGYLSRYLRVSFVIAITPPQQDVKKRKKRGKKDQDARNRSTRFQHYARQ